MATTTVLNDDTATIVSDDTSPKRFSWSAAFAGAFVATAVTLLLLTLGAGVGLSLVTARHATESGTVTFLTLGAIYFLVAQAFGFAAGGHIVGRMIGPALETDRDEEIRAGTHGLMAWAVAVVATATLIALAAVAGGAATANGAIGAALTSASPARSDGAAAPSGVTAYWVDTLFRPPSAKTALLSFRRYAQADSTATDAPPPNDSTITPDQSMPAANSSAEPEPTPPNSSTVFLGGGSTTPTSPATMPPDPTITPRSLAADKAEAGRILAVGMANGGSLSGDDRAQLARIVANDTGMGLDPATVRVNDVVKRIRDTETKAAEIARKSAAYASLWTAFALLFGAIVSIAAAISARWEDDKEHGLLPGTRVSEVRY